MPPPPPGVDVILWYCIAALLLIGIVAGIWMLIRRLALAGAQPRSAGNERLETLLNELLTEIRELRREIRALMKELEE